MSKYQNTLERYGLTTNEAAIYLAMLNYGHSTVLTIAMETEIKRPTVYITLESLINKKLVKIAIHGKKHYLPAKPNQLIKLLEEKKQSIADIIPELNNKFQNKNEKPKISFYEGKDGVRQIYQDALKSNTEVLWYGSIKDMKEAFSDIYMASEKEHERHPKGSREIVNNTKFEKDYARILNNSNDPKAKVKILSGDLFFLNTDNIIYDNNVAILSIRKDYYGIIIESPDIANTYRAMFELAWKTAKTP